MIHGTTYGPGFYSVVHCDPGDLERVLELRGIGERSSPVVSDAPPASVLFERAMLGEPVRDIDVAHALVFLAHLATSSGVCSAADALADLGWLHEAIHWLALRTGPEWTETLERIRAVERAVPGVLPR